MAVLHRKACGVTRVPQVGEDRLLLARHHPPGLNHAGTSALANALSNSGVYSFGTHVVDGGD